MDTGQGNGTDQTLSKSQRKRQRRSLSKGERQRRAREKAEAAVKAAALVPKPDRPAPETYEAPAAADGENVIHETGITGRPIALKLDTLHKLRRTNKITHKLYNAGEAYLGVVQTYYDLSSGLCRLSDEAPNASGNADPIRLYVKGRRSYVPTQRPRNVSSPKSSFDGWTKDRSTALKAMHRVRTALKFVDGEALRVLYALVIHPSDPHRRPTTLRAYVLQRFGYRNQRIEDHVIECLKEALGALYDEFGEIQELEFDQVA